MALRHPAVRYHPHRPIVATQVSSSSEFESNIPIMVDRQFPLHSRGRRANYFLRNVCRRCSNIKVAVVLRLGLVVFLTGVVVLTGVIRRPGDGYKGQKANELLQALYELNLPSSREELAALNEELAYLDPLFILKWAHHITSTSQNDQHLRHNKNQLIHPLVQVTSFGPTGLVILHLLSRLHVFNDVPVITLDTLHLFKESYAFYNEVKHHPMFDGIDLTITMPIDEDLSNGPREFKTRDEFDEKYGRLWKTDPKRYTKLTKLDPLERLFRQWEVKMWITGRRRSQGGERSSLQVLEFENCEALVVDDSNPFASSKGRWKLNPLAFWTYDQVWSYIRKQKLPYNPLYDQGYTSLGDEMTTRLPNKDLQKNESFERSGRFAGLNQTECGLHSHREKISAKKEQALAAGAEWEVPTLSCVKCIDLDTANFEEFIRSGDSGVLLEFYSPYCGSCQEFAPTMARIADHLSSGADPLKVARFDITEHDPPLIDNKNVFLVEATPTLYRITYSPFYVELYEGEHDFGQILKWLGKL
ncbi:hypothetical protein HJC23_006506 [Cyclotella cryptica]|uniref:Thioredoxin domain-containing protein n=1 Tax=Cyclotella cryptica TaxID=29204 RepID=A0ABD3PNK5_9STRA|eukprot:CCRYP_012989-RA/>CCRYP_012989-RA protein AED:0.08 eAED:0.08 QI:0/-1/0/1/-1/1/1/0/529